MYLAVESTGLKVYDERNTARRLGVLSNNYNGVWLPKIQRL